VWVENGDLPNLCEEAFHGAGQSHSDFHFNLHGTPWVLSGSQHSISNFNFIHWAHNCKWKHLTHLGFKFVNNEFRHKQSFYQIWGFINWMGKETHQRSVFKQCSQNVFLLIGNFLPLQNFQIKTFQNKSRHFWAHFV
jgi:hypothetical protein